MSSIKPFNIAVPDEQLKQLHQKLEHATFPDELDEAGWDMGVPLAEMKKLVKTWRDDFDWRSQEKKLNEQLNQLAVPVSVDGFGELEIHVVHHRSGKENAIPLLFIHGCMKLQVAVLGTIMTCRLTCRTGPGSFLEATKLIPLLVRDDNGPAFDVVAPSLPNYGFSQGVQKVFNTQRQDEPKNINVRTRKVSAWPSTPKPSTE